MAEEGGTPTAPDAMVSALYRTVSSVAARGRDRLVGEYLRAEPEVLYSTLEDFQRADPSLKRVVVLGSTGSGKSTLLNIMGGWGFKQRESDNHKFWEPKNGRPPLFRAAASTASLTSRLEMARIHWFGDPERSFYAIDTPGCDDSQARDITQQETRDLRRMRALDLHNKFRALGQVDLILVLHNDVLSIRFNPVLYELLDMLDQKFAAAHRARPGQEHPQSVWNNVVFAYSKCNEGEFSWRGGLEEKKVALQQKVRREIPGCNVDVPVLFLGGLRLERDSAQPSSSSGRNRSRSRSPRRRLPHTAGTSAEGAGSVDAGPNRDGPSDFDELWRRISEAQPLSTANLQPFEGADVRFQRLINERDALAAQVRAARIYLSVVLKLSAVSTLLFWRGCLIPNFASMLLLNLPGPFDDACVIAGVVYLIGSEDVMYSLRHVYREWILPWVSATQPGLPATAPPAAAQVHQHQD